LRGVIREYRYAVLPAVFEIAAPARLCGGLRVIAHVLGYFDPPTHHGDRISRLRQPGQVNYPVPTAVEHGVYAVEVDLDLCAHLVALRSRLSATSQDEHRSQNPLPDS
jgi:hypothetical protein